VTSNLVSRARKAAPFQTCSLVCTDYCKISSWPLQLLTEAATVSAAVARTVLTSVTNALDLFDQPAIVLNRLGVVLGTNAAAESSFDDEFGIETRRLIVGDKLADAALVQATQDDAAFPTEPIIVKSCRRPPIIIWVVPIYGAVGGLLLGARVLLLLTDLGKRLVPKTRLIARTFALSVAETRIAERIAAGVSLEKAAEDLGISRETARNHLKAVFAKTGTHRQSELVALLSRF
jgi:DNA-binding CsgD family transcriptional regulator